MKRRAFKIGTTSVLVLSLVLSMVLCRSEGQAQWDTSHAIKVESDNTLTYVLVGALGVAVIVGVIIIANHTSTPQKAPGVGLDSMRVVAPGDSTDVQSDTAAHSSLMLLGKAGQYSELNRGYVYMEQIEARPAVSFGIGMEKDHSSQAAERVCFR